MVYRVELRPAALRDFKRLSLEIQARIRPVVERLADDPRPPGVKKLSAQEDRYRIRVGDHRIVYEIQDGVLVIMVFRIAHRREVYRQSRLSESTRHRSDEIASPGGHPRTARDTLLSRRGDRTIRFGAGTQT